MATRFFGQLVTLLVLCHLVRFLTRMEERCLHLHYFLSLREEEAYALLHQQIPEITTATTLREIRSGASENHKNVVLVTLKSCSRDFMKMYGNDQNRTSFLDSLATKNFLFTKPFRVTRRLRICCIKRNSRN